MKTKPPCGYRFSRDLSLSPFFQNWKWHVFLLFSVKSFLSLINCYSEYMLWGPGFTQISPIEFPCSVGLGIYFLFFAIFKIVFKTEVQSLQHLADTLRGNLWDKNWLWFSSDLGVLDFPIWGLGIDLPGFCFCLFVWGVSI